MTKPVYIVDIFSQVVALVRADVLTTIQANETAALNKPSLITTINYQFGHKMELLETLAQMDRSVLGKYEKYPLIWLVTDFVENRGRDAGIYAELNLRIYIIHQTDNVYKAAEREMLVFRPVLYPIYYSLIDNLVHNIPQTMQGNPDMVKHDKINRYYLGKQALGGNTANMVNEFCDAIELQNFNVEFNYQPCV